MAKRRLRDRRTTIIRLYILFGILGLALVFGGGTYGMWRPEVRVNAITISGADITSPQEITREVEKVLSGTYLRALPKDNIFLISEKEIQKTLLYAFPRLRSVFVEQTSFTSIEINVSERDPVAMWCSGATTTLCMLSDENGFLFAPSNEGLIPVYGALAIEAEPLRNTIFAKGVFLNVYSLSRTFERINLPVSNIVFRKPDEVVFTLAAGPRVEYVLGEEAHIAETFPTVLEGIESLSDIDYIDMRFGKRVYIKRHE